MTLSNQTALADTRILTWALFPSSGERETEGRQGERQNESE